MVQPMIQVKNLAKSFGSNRVLNGISFKVDRGEVMVIIGPSGSGKSTVLRCLNFLEEYDEGEVWIDEQLMGYRLINGEQRVRQSETEVARLRCDIGMVFQSFNLFPHRSVLDNVTMAPIRVKGMKAREATDLALELLNKVDLADKVKEFPAKLSGGQQQRVAIARALAMQPKVMLFDEVTSALDPELVGEVLSVMRQLATEGMTMVIVSHEMHFARDIGDRLLFIDHGKVVEEGVPGDVLGNPQSDRLKSFLRRFIEAYYLEGA
jgi:polar amino acid transport system ATP-binding protein